MAFPAMYEGWCSKCGGDIDPGEMITKENDVDSYVHEEC